MKTDNKSLSRAVKETQGSFARSLLVVYARDPYKLILCVTVHGSEQAKFIANYISTFKWRRNTVGPQMKHLCLLAKEIMKGIF